MAFKQYRFPNPPAEKKSGFQLTPYQAYEVQRNAENDKRTAARDTFERSKGQFEMDRQTQNDTQTKRLRDAEETRAQIEKKKQDEDSQDLELLHRVMSGGKSADELSQDAKTARVPIKTPLPANSGRGMQVGDEFTPQPSQVTGYKWQPSPELAEYSKHPIIPARFKVLLDKKAKEQTPQQSKNEQINANRAADFIVRNPKGNDGNSLNEDQIMQYVDQKFHVDPSHPAIQKALADLKAKTPPPEPGFDGMAFLKKAASAVTPSFMKAPPLTPPDKNIKTFDAPQADETNPNETEPDSDTDDASGEPDQYGFTVGQTIDHPTRGAHVYVGNNQWEPAP